MIGVAAYMKIDEAAPPMSRHIGAGYTFIDLFAGIGGFRLGLESVGARCVFSSEWDRFAQLTYAANFGEQPAGDITKVAPEAIPDHDILVGGFPCQPFSLAGVSKANALGRRHGFEHATQGTLFFNVAKILQVKRPRAFILENVKNLVSHAKGRTFETILTTLKDELGYDVHYAVLDARKVVPQHRERIYIVGFRAPTPFKFPQLKDRAPTVREILEDAPDPKYTLSNKLWQYLQAYAKKHREAGNGFGYGIAPMDGVSRTLSARYYKDGSEILIAQANSNPRRLTPRECARLMGFPERYRIPVSDTRAYKQFGNSVAVPVVAAIGKAVLGALGKKERTGSQPQSEFSFWRSSEPSLASL
jgi:DNA (cytosine-5)-methyltransferase 1